MIRFACPGCTATFTVAADKAGKAGKCPKCQSQFVIPAEGMADDDPAAGDLAPLTVTDSVQPPALPTEPPPLPAPPVETDPVEVRPCPNCQERLSVLPADVGKDVACPKCETVFRAERMSAARGGDRRRERTEDDERRQSRWERNRELNGESDRRRSRYDDEDDRDRGYRPSRGGSGGGFRCRGCGSRDRPVYKEEISTAGWVVFAVMLTVCFPLFWIGLLMKEQYRACGECGRKAL
jgi:ssDNA-binding Zn-finger/Zn-ribbon topoisomerase 1